MLKHEKIAERQGYKFIIGIDEAGRGPLAGPVVASAVVLKTRHFLNKITDSKKLSVRQREAAFHEIYEKAHIGIGIINETVIDRHNILKATYFAMNNAIRDVVTKLPLTIRRRKNFPKSICLFVDGKSFHSETDYDYKTIIQGDCKSLSIACASIIAKVFRDRILEVYDQVYPDYGFRQHKGYPTLKHKQAIKRHGLSSIHRKTFGSKFIHN